METTFTEEEPEVIVNHFFNFTGNGKDLFIIRLVNLMLSLVTLGLYYPWAKAKTLKYLYSETQLDEEPFTFHGTGKEMFKGFIKIMAIILFLYFLPTLVSLSGASGSLVIVATLITFIGFMVLIPLAIHGTVRYRMSRTSYRGIHFGYRGSLKELSKLYYWNLFLAIITLGIYVPWMTINLRGYVISNIRYGSKEFNYYRDGGELFLINLKYGFISFFVVMVMGFILGDFFAPASGFEKDFLYKIGVFYVGMLLTILLVQGFYKKDVFNFHFNRTSISDNSEHRFYGMMDNSEVFTFLIKNVPLLLFTVGIAWPWVQTNLLRMVFYNLQIDGTLNLSDVEQTETAFTDASGEDLGDFLDIDIL
ncbi:YjgN family protein [Arcticibacterium luteifluviistationis]|uniref:DUF898 domain-containing protein n=1 Tax=Arcticibacterium luteifluviistationis TaxID=1784714 RepID=A0A2Z4G848_9BACT|nr:YjgN family protein [Arcticibacterium luteifluviistationis]AWV97337.1 DUF898 domain-containing protein [Arcticibacterium luteifluviistationis]